MHNIVSFGEWLRQRRNAFHLTQDELAKRLGCALGTLRKWESDERRPSMELAEHLARVFKVPESDQAVFVKVARGELGVAHLGVPADPAAPLPARFPPLPIPRSPLLGRDQELESVKSLLLRDDVGLVTLTGPGGTGKTRLALQVAHDLRTSFPDGVAFVDLSALIDPTLVAPTLARTLGVKEVGEQPVITTLAAWLRSQCLLLVIDNFEQVAAAAWIIADLLHAAPQVNVLVTSRAPLHVYGEHELPVSPLPLPDVVHLPPVAVLSHYAAICLFVARAQAVQAAFRLTADNAAAVAQICAHVDGLPLAIELAAARIKFMSPQMLLERLQADGHAALHMLRAGARDLPPRHHTLRHMIAWSYDLLHHDEQRLFRRLGVCRGGWSVEAARAVSTVADERPCDLEEGLEVLLEHNLIVQRSPVGTEQRLGMLETLREYAVEQLAASGEAAQIRSQHAAYYLSLAETAAQQLHGPDQVQWLDRLDADHDNLRATLQWAIDERNGDVALRVCAALWRFWERRGYVGEGRRWLDAALAMSTDAPASLRASALDAAGWLAFFCSDLKRATTLHEESLSLCQAVGDKQGIANALRALGGIAADEGDTSRGRALAEESLALYRELGDHEGMVRVLGNLAIDAADQCDYRRATALHDEALVISRASGDLWNQALALSYAAFPIYEQGDFIRATSLAEEALAVYRRLGAERHYHFPLIVGILALAVHAQGDRTRATALHEECLALARDVGNTLAQANACLGLGYIAYEQGERERAQQWYEEAFVLYQEIGDMLGVAEVFRLRGHIAQDDEEFERALRLYQQSLALYQERQARFAMCVVLMARASLWAAQGQWLCAVRLFGAAQGVLDGYGAQLGSERFLYEPYLTAARTSLNEHAYAQARAEGQTMTLEQAIAYAFGEERSSA